MVSDEVESAIEALQSGALVVYPTETVYGLGADALDPVAIQRVFEAKNRDRSKPVSMAVSDLGAVDEYTRPGERAQQFMETFLPGPVTVVVERADVLPDELTAGRDRVGIRIPDSELARELARRVGPITSTSANVSGNESARKVEGLDDQIREFATVVLDGGKTPGGGSTVVDVEGGIIHRRGPNVHAIERWLEEH